jgi:hypothetical protein
VDTCCLKCAPQALCPKCSLLEVIRFRFGAFREKFGRDPRSDEPLFFDPAEKWPAKASVDQARAQIHAAAAAMGVRVEPVLRFLKLDPGHAEAQCPAQGDVISQRRSRRASWEKFVRDKRLHQQHGITAAELEMLSQVALMGETRASGDFLFILDKIRHTRRQ